MRFALSQCVLLGVASTAFGATVEGRPYVHALREMEGHSIDRRDFNPFGLLQNIKLPFFQASTTAKPTATAKAAALSNTAAASKAAEEVMDAVGSINIPLVLRTHIIPVLVTVLKEIQQFSGERLLSFLGTIKGKTIVDEIRKLDTKPFWQLFKDFHGDKFVDAVFNVTSAPVITKLQKISGADLVAFVEALTGSDIAKFALDILDMYNARSLLQTIGIDETQFTKALSTLKGSDIIKFVEGLDGQEVINFIAKTDGEGLIKFLNKYISLFMSQIRQITSQVFNGTTPAEYTDFDLIKVVDSTQAFVEKLSGLKFPTISAMIKNFSGKTLLDQVKKIDLEGVIDFALAAQHAAMQVGKVAANYTATGVSGAKGLNEAGNKMVQKILADFKVLTGEKILQLISTFDPKPIVQLIKQNGVIQVVKMITTVDLEPFVDAIAKFNGATLIKNIESLTTTDIETFFTDVGFEQYMLGFTGVPSADILKLLKSFDGKSIISGFKTLKGSDIIDLFTAVTTGTN